MGPGAGAVHRSVRRASNATGVTYCVLRRTRSARRSERRCRDRFCWCPLRTAGRFSAILRAGAGFLPLPSLGSGAAPVLRALRQPSGLMAQARRRHGTCATASRFHWLSRRLRMDVCGVAGGVGAAYVLAREDECLHLLLHAILDRGTLGPPRRDRLRTLFYRDQDGRARGSIWSINSACTSRQPVGWPALIRGMTDRRLGSGPQPGPGSRPSFDGAAAGFGAPGMTELAGSPRRLRPLALALHGPGVAVALLGPDGAGKTCLAGEGRAVRAIFGREGSTWATGLTEIARRGPRGIRWLVRFGGERSRG